MFCHFWKRCLFNFSIVRCQIKLRTSTLGARIAGHIVLATKKPHLWTLSCKMFGSTIDREPNEIAYREECVLSLQPAWSAGDQCHLTRSMRNISHLIKLKSRTYAMKKVVLFQMERIVRAQKKKYISSHRHLFEQATVFRNVSQHITMKRQMFPYTA